MYNYGIERKLQKKSDDETMVDFQTQSPQRMIDKYKHMNSQNYRLMMGLKAIKVEYYSIGNQKSYSDTM